MRLTNRAMIVLSLLLVGLITVQVFQYTNLSKQTEQVKSRLKQVKQDKKKATAIKENPSKQLENVKTATQKVSEFVDLFSNSSAVDYDNKLHGLASSAVISQLKSELAPSVTFEQRPTYKVATVAVDRAWGDTVKYNVVAQSDSQSVAYLVTYDLVDHQVTKIVRMPISGEYHGEQ